MQDIFAVPYNIKLFIFFLILDYVGSCTVGFYSEALKNRNIPKNIGIMQGFLPRLNFLGIQVVLTVISKAPAITDIRLRVFQPVKIFPADEVFWSESDFSPILTIYILPPTPEQLHTGTHKNTRLHTIPHRKTKPG